MPYPFDSTLDTLRDVVTGNSKIYDTAKAVHDDTEKIMAESGNKAQATAPEAPVRPLTTTTSNSPATQPTTQAPATTQTSPVQTQKPTVPVPSAQQVPKSDARNQPAAPTQPQSNNRPEKFTKGYEGLPKSPDEEIPAAASPFSNINWNLLNPDGSLSTVSKIGMFAVPMLLMSLLGGRGFLGNILGGALTGAGGLAGYEGGRWLMNNQKWAQDLVPEQYRPYAPLVTGIGGALLAYLLQNSMGKSASFVKLASVYAQSSKSRILMS